MPKYPLAALLLLTVLAVPLRAKTPQADSTPTKASRRVHVSTNFGAKAGFTAALALFQDFRVDGLLVDQVQNDYKVGYFASLFMRINLNRHFLQPELSYNVNECGITFDKPLPPDAATGTLRGGKATINSRIRSIDLPVIYGYNFIRQGPYAMAVFGGPKLRYIWRSRSRTDYRNFDTDDLSERLHPFSLSLTLGVSVTISPLFIDFRYDIGLLNLTRSVSAPAGNGDERPHSVSYRRHDNVLSFSLGLFF